MLKSLNFISKKILINKTSSTCIIVQLNRTLRNHRFQKTKHSLKIINSNNGQQSFAAIDNEKYLDHDFDFDDDYKHDHKSVVNRQQKPKTFKQLFKDDFEKQKQQQRQSKFVNALYDDDYEEYDNQKHYKHKKKHSNNSLRWFDSDNNNDGMKKMKKALIPLPYTINEENRFDILNDIVMPLHKIPYEQQLKRKLYAMKDILKSFGSKLPHLNKTIRIGSNNMPCLLEDVKPSPLTEHYRNKDEFSIWPGIDGNPKTVGFFIGQPSKHDRVICVEPDHLKISKQSHIDLAKKFQQYLRDVSPLEICQNYGEGGHWRRVHIRSNRNDEHMLTAILHPQNLDENALQEEMQRFKAYFADDPRLHSLYFHATRHTRSTHTNEPYYHLAGESTIIERLFNKKFVISPSSFFQVNTMAAEILYRTIITEMNISKNATILDLCCGTGTLSILLSDQVKKIIAIDSSESAINDARKNAEINGANNIEFICGTIEKELPQLLSETLIKKPVIAIANPSRRALHPKVISTLKRMSFIDRLVYVSCKPQGDALRNFVQLCLYTSATDELPFYPVNAVPVDLFPHTEHCELILTFERL